MPEVSVVPFPETDAGWWPVSTGGGWGPEWSGDGSALFYVDSADQLVKAEITTDPAFEVGDSTPLFSVAEYAWNRGYGVHPDGERFLFIRPTGREAQNRLVLVENFFELLKSSVGR